LGAAIVQAVAFPGPAAPGRHCFAPALRRTRDPFAGRSPARPCDW